MIPTVDLVQWGGDVPQGTFANVSALQPWDRASPPEFDRAVSSGEAEWILCWDAGLGPIDLDAVEQLTHGRADIWHSGLSCGLAGEPAEHDYIHPVWPLARDADSQLEAVSWRVSLRCSLVRRETLEIIGGLDPACSTLLGAGLEWGRRAIDRGAVVMHTPRLGVTTQVPERLSEHDRFVFLWRTFGAKWVWYSALRRMIEVRRVISVLRGCVAARTATRNHPRPGHRLSTVRRSPATLPDSPQVTVVIPTLGRSEQLETVLDQLRHQRLAAAQVIVVDQNPPADRDLDMYGRFSDLPLEVIFETELGQWRARNAGVARATGDWIAFLDDDSLIDERFLAAHLEGLLRYRADLSTGASKAVIGAPVPANYAYFRVADQWDSGNGMCHASLFERVDGFDQQYDRQRRGDAEFGLRVQLAGGLVVHTPDAVRVHLKTQSGGLRTFGSLDGFRHRDRSGPLPLPSMGYYTRRYHTDRQRREDLRIGLLQAIVPYELKRRAAPAQWARFLVAELPHIGSTVRRIRQSSSQADRMAAEGPILPGFADGATGLSK